MYVCQINNSLPPSFLPSYTDVKLHPFVDVHNVVELHVLPVECKPIQGCQQLVCASSSDEQCQRCVYDYGSGMKAFRPARKNGKNNTMCES